VSSVLPGSQLSNVPWRRQGVKYANNEAYFDCIEDVDAIIDANGTVVSAEIHGNVRNPSPVWNRYKYINVLKNDMSHDNFWLQFDRLSLLIYYDNYNNITM